MQDNHNLSDDEKTLLKSVSFSRLILPVFIGLGVVFYLMSKQLDFKELDKVSWGGLTFLWLGFAVLMYIFRHFFYAWRLYSMADGSFSFWKCMELIVIWEFSSAVSPTNVGGAGVALVLLAQEKVSGARTVAIVLYSMVLDTVYTLISLPLLYFIVGPTLIRPGMKSLTDIDGYGFTFITVIIFMLVYGGVFFYGLFVNPRAIKRLLILLSRIPFLKKFRNDLRNTAVNVVTAAIELRGQSWKFHMRNMLCTMGAWTTRFLGLNFIILAIVPKTSLAAYDQFLIFARGEAMYVITAFSPTPGGAGIAEYLFGGFYSDYIPEGIASLVSLIWRLITYYPYLIAGAIVIPIWIRGVIKSRKAQQDKGDGRV